MVFDYSDSSERKTFVVSYCYFKKCSAMSMVPLLSYLVSLYAVTRSAAQRKEEREAALLRMHAYGRSTVAS